jgi:Protein of unknown function (DUF4232)
MYHRLTRAGPGSGAVAALLLLAGCSTMTSGSGTATGGATGAPRRPAVSSATPADASGGSGVSGDPQATTSGLPVPIHAGGIGAGGAGTGGNRGVGTSGNGVGTGRYGGGSGGGSGTGSASSSPGTASPVPPPRPAPTSPAPPPPPPPLPTCDHANLGFGLSHPPGGGSAGHNGYLIWFQNLAHTPCTLTGYPGVAGASVAGADLYDVTRSPRGMYGGLPAGTVTPPVLVLGFNTIVSAIVEWSDVPSGAATSCPSYPHILITPPNTSSTAHFVAPLVGCDLTVHPVVAGGAGGGPSA